MAAASSSTYQAKTRDQLCSAAEILTVLELSAFLIMNIAGIKGLIENSFVIGVTNLSLSGVPISILTVLSCSNKTNNSRCKELAVAVALLSPLIIVNALSVFGVAALQPAHVLGWSSFASIIGVGVSVGVIDCFVIPGHKFTPNKERVAKERKAREELAKFQKEYIARFDKATRQKIDSLKAKMQQTYQDEQYERFKSNDDPAIYQQAIKDAYPGIGFWERRAYCAAVECVATGWALADAARLQNEYESAFRGVEQFGKNNKDYLTVLVPSPAVFIEEFQKAHPTFFN